MGVAELLRCKVPQLVVLLHLCLVFNEACDDEQAWLVGSSPAFYNLTVCWRSTTL